MKKKMAGKRSAKAKGKGAPKDFDEYLAGAPKAARAKLKEMRALIGSVVPPEATETISYRIPAYRHNGVLVWFAGFAKHCSLFPTASVIAAFQEELKGYSTSKGTVHFAIDKELPGALIKKLVKARVAEHERKKG